MFQSKGLFAAVPCPDPSCSRPTCLLSHRKDLPKPTLNIRVAHAKVPTPSSSSSSIPAKRSATELQSHASSAPASRPSISNSANEPPRKLQKLGNVRKPSAVPTATRAATGEPILRVSAASSTVPVVVRQTMIKSLYDHFIVLYEKLLPAYPELASDHTLRQEEDVYKSSTKFAYRNAVINTIASIKRREIPNSISHPSVGTERDISERKEKKTVISSIHLTRDHLEPHILTMDEMKEWGYFTEVPQEPGGTEPSIEGKVVPCERCAQPFPVKRKDEADICDYHWGRPYARKVNGEKMRVFTCCSRPVSEGGGCTQGPHVFYEHSLAQLHSRHAFSMLPEPQDDERSALDVVALDCEMIYTTGGMRVARVSVVDGAGVEVFDEVVRMDDGVEVIDFNTRFSGITDEVYSQAVMKLSSVRDSLNSLMNRDTIIIGHALDNDLKTLRIIHHKCIDTALLPPFRHGGGPPYRKALRALAKEHLDFNIQTGGAAGHSSVEDSKATLDLVRWFVVQKGKSKPDSLAKPSHNTGSST